MTHYKAYTLDSLLEEYSCQTFFMMGMINREQKQTERQMKGGNQSTLANYGI